VEWAIGWTMTSVETNGSLRNRLALILTGGAAVLAVVLVFVVRNYAAQIAQQGQDNILAASVTSVLDTAVLRDGAVELDFPYASLSMLSTPADDRVFYAIYEDGVLLSGYSDLAVHGNSNVGWRGRSAPCVRFCRANSGCTV